MSRVGGSVVDYASVNLNTLIASLRTIHCSDWVTIATGEQLIVPCTKTMVKLVLGEKSADKLCVISLSNDAVRHRMCEPSLYIKEQVIQGKNAGLLNIQLDESTDVQSCSQLMVFVRYVHIGDLGEGKKA